MNLSTSNASSRVLSLNLANSSDGAKLEWLLINAMNSEFQTPHFETGDFSQHRWSTEIEQRLMASGCKLRASSRSWGRATSLYLIPDAVAGTERPTYVLIAPESRIEVLAESRSEAEAVIRFFHQFLEPIEQKEQEITIRFLAQTNSFSRPLEAAEWSNIELNYPASIRDQLAALMIPPKGPESGRIIVFNGPPGTGKTFAVRALARSWGREIMPHCVIDPERLLTNPTYLMEVLGPQSEFDPFADEPYYRNEDHLPKLLILEDVDELLSIDAKTQMTQAVSRLLNLGDGLLGQVADCYFLMTANNDVDKLLPALTRPGRCLGLVDFRHFTQPEAQDWLDLHGGAHPAPAGTSSLAELYGQLRPEGVSSVRKASEGLLSRGR